MTELTHEARQFLAEHQSAGRPTSLQRAQVRSAVVATLAIAPMIVKATAGTQSGWASAPAGLGAASGLTAGSKLVAAFVVSVAAGFAVALPVAQTWRAQPPSGSDVRPSRASSAAPATEPMVQQINPVPPPDSARGTPGRAAAKETRPPPGVAAPEAAGSLPPAAAAGEALEPPRLSGAPAPPPPAEPRLTVELKLLSSAQAALRAGEASRCLSLLDEHARIFGADARLSEEARAARVLALCALGRAAEARTEAQRLEQESPASPHLIRTRAACW